VQLVELASLKVTTTVDFAKSFGKKEPVNVMLSDPNKFISWAGVKVEMVHSID
jgi:hypothetical protein